ncbi:MAG: hypothetical protein ABH834_07365 [Candidatus Altiarchaeota archaeon]
MTYLAYDIHLYITDHQDALPDLHTMEHIDEVRSWFSQVNGVCVHHDHFSKISDDLLKEAKNHPIKQAFAVIFYPPGEMLEADEEVGEELKKLFKSHRVKFSWNLTSNDRLTRNFYDVYLELIVKKSKVVEEGEKPKDAAAEKKEEQERLSLAEKEKMLLGDLHPESTDSVEEAPGRDTRSLEDKILDRLGDSDENQ